MGGVRNGCGILVRGLGGRRRLIGGLGVDVGMLLKKWILGKQGGKLWTGCIWFRIRASGWRLSTR